MWQTVKAWCIKTHASFHKSGTLVFARLQVLAGVAFEVLKHTDLSPLITNQKYMTYWLIASGVISEMVRRSGSEVNEEGHLVPRKED